MSKKLNSNFVAKVPAASGPAPSPAKDQAPPAPKDDSEKDPDELFALREELAEAIAERDQAQRQLGVMTRRVNSLEKLNANLHEALAAKPKPQTKTELPSGAGYLRITALNGKSFWRCGLEFTGAPRDLALSELSEEQIKTLKADPQLVTQELVA